MKDGKLRPGDIFWDCDCWYIIKNVDELEGNVGLIMFAWDNDICEVDFSIDEVYEMVFKKNIKDLGIPSLVRHKDEDT